MPVPRLVVVALTGVLTVAALGGCGGDESDQPRPLAPYTPSPSSPSSLTTPTPSATPSTASDLERSAQDFVRAYYREYNRAFHESDPSRLERDFFVPSCRQCAKGVEILEGFQRKRQHFEGYEFVLVASDVSELRATPSRIRSCFTTSRVAS